LIPAFSHLSELDLTEFTQNDDLPNTWKSCIADVLFLIPNWVCPSWKQLL